MGEWKNQTLKKAMQRSLPEWVRALGRRKKPDPERARLLRIRCPSCDHKFTIYCVRSNFGSGTVDPKPRYAHICTNPNCGFVVEGGIWSKHYPDKEAMKKFCPWCFRA